jgi:hypothetical protein
VWRRHPAAGEARGGVWRQRRRLAAEDAFGGGGQWPTAVEGMMPRPPSVGGSEEVEEEGGCGRGAEEGELSGGGRREGR